MVMWIPGVKLLHSRYCEFSEAHEAVPPSVARCSWPHGLRFPYVSGYLSRTFFTARRINGVTGSLVSLPLVWYLLLPLRKGASVGVSCKRLLIMCMWRMAARYGWIDEGARAISATNRIGDLLRCW